MKLRISVLSLLLAVLPSCRNGDPETLPPLGTPVIATITPGVASPGELIAVQGSDFGTRPDTLRIGDAAAEIVSWDSTVITALVPQMEGAVEVVVSARGKESAPFAFLVTQPSISKTAPNQIVSLGAGPFYVDSVLSAFAYGFVDEKGKALKVQFQWFKDGDAIAGATAATLRGEFAKGDEIHCRVTPSTGPAVISETIVIANSAPVIQSVSLSAEPYTAATLITAFPLADDADGDAVTFSYAWYVNGALVSTAPILTGDWFAAGDTVAVLIGAFDGDAFGEPVSSNLTTIETLPPIITAVTPGPLRSGQWFTVTGSGFTNAQGEGAVEINAVAADIVAWYPTAITAIVPPGLTAGAATVLVSLRGRTRSFTYSSNDVTAPIQQGTPTLSTLTIAGLNGPLSTVQRLTVAVDISHTWIGDLEIWLRHPSGVSAQLHDRTGGPQSYLRAEYSTTVFDGLDANAQWTLAVTDSAGPNDGQLNDWSITLAGNDGALSNSYFAPIAPWIASLFPTPATAGQTVSLTGTGFGPLQGSGSVSVGGMPATVIAWTSTAIQFTFDKSVPPGQQVVQVRQNGQDSGTVALTVRPFIVNVSPLSAASGENVVVDGVGFGTAGNILLDKLGVDVTTWNAGNIQFQIPAAVTAGVYPLWLLTNGEAARGPDFTVLPKINALSPGSATGGSAVVIAGSGFGSAQNGSSVSVANGVITPSMWAADSISIQVPSTVTAGTHNVSLQIAGIASNSLSLALHPSIYGVSPTTASGSDVVTLTGGNFGSTSAGNTVTVGGTPVTTTSWTHGTVTFTLPAALAAGNRNIVITVGGQSSAAAAIAVKPSISGIAPGAQVGGSSVVVSGQQFGAAQGTSSVSVGGVNATVSAWSSTALTIVVPTTMAAGVLDVVVTVGSQASAPASLTVTPNNALLSPASGSLGTPITLTGTNFGATRGASSLVVGATDVATTSWGNASVTFTIPASITAGTHAVRVTVGGQVSNARNLSISPSLAGVTPAVGTGGDSITLSGANLGLTQGTSTVSLGGVVAPPTSWSNTAVAFQVPATTAPGIQNLSATVGGWSAAPITFAVKPTVTATSPAMVSGGETLTISGTNFGYIQGSTSVILGGVTLSIVSWSMSSIVATVAGNIAPGNQTLLVTRGAPITSLGKQVVIRPAVTAVAPANGPIGTPVVFTGTNLGAAQGGAEVQFREGAAWLNANVSGWSMSTAAVTVPAGLSPGAHQVRIVAGGQASNDVTYTVGPRIISLSPASATAGTVIVVNGSAFGASQGSSVLTVNGSTVTPGSWNDTTLAFTLPALTPIGIAQVMVEVSGVASNSSNLSVTDDSLPAAPGNAKALSLAAGQASLTWLDSASTETGYSVERKTLAAGAYALVATLPAGTQAFTNTLLAHGESYVYRVRAFNANGNSAYSNEATVTVRGGTFAATSIAAGGSHTCALTAASGVKCWGNNDFGQLGDGTATGATEPTTVRIAGSVASISAGEYHTCALTNAGTVSCWGNNDYGQLGVTSATDVLEPRQVNLTGVTALTAGGYHTCVLLSSGGVQCWGENAEHQLGDGTATQRNYPAAVSGLASGVLAIEAGNVHTCAVMQTGGAKCWGSNLYARLGDGTSATRSTPVDVSGLSSGVTAISAGGGHACALLNTGGLQCWGINSSGQLGDTTTAIRNAPVNVSGLASGVTSVTAGYLHTCALLAAGGTRCWGNNTVGQVGDGTVTERLSPVSVTGVTVRPTSIAAGDYHSCVRNVTGGVQCWGLNWAGEAGDRTTTQRNSPVWVGGARTPPLFADTMTTSVLSPALWASATGDTAVSTLYSYSGSYALMLGGGGATVVSTPSNSSICTGQVNWRYRGKRGPEMPDAGDYLRLQYLNSSSAWVDADVWEGSSATDSAFVLRAGSITLSNAFHSGFAMRFVSTGSGTTFDNYFIDDFEFGCAAGQAFSIAGLSSMSASYPSSVTLSGTGFGATQGTGAITVGGVPATIVSWSDTAIVFQLPSAASNGTQPVVVTVNGSTGSTSANIVVVPTLTSLSPSTGPIGSVVTINGGGFGSSQGGSYVVIDGSTLATVNSWSSNSISFVMPGSAAGTFNVQLWIGGQWYGNETFVVTNGGGNPPVKSVAILDDAGYPSYFAGGNANLWNSVQAVYDADPQGRFATTVITDFATLASFDILVLPDNAVPDADLGTVDTWFQSGGKVIVMLDSAISFAFYSGYLTGTPGSNGSGTGWEYGSTVNEQRIAVANEATQAYTLGDIIGSAPSDAALFKSSLNSDVTILTESFSVPDYAYAVSRDVPAAGSRIVVLGPFDPIPADTHDLIRDASFYEPVTTPGGGGGSLVTVFEDDMESGANGWTHTATMGSDLWNQIGDPTCAPSYASAGSSWYFGVTGTCNFSTGARVAGRLSSPTITALPANAILRFKYRRMTECDSCSYDITTVSVGVGAASTQVMEAVDNTGTWIASGDIDLAAFAGEDIKLYFDFDSVDSTANAQIGWMIDDVQILAPSSGGGGGGGGAGAGPYVVTPATFSWRTEAQPGVGTQIFGPNTDDQIATLSLPFNVSLYGVSYNTVSVSSNGFVSFGTQSADGCCGGTLPTTNLPNSVMMDWEDKMVSSSGSIRYAIAGASPDRSVVISYFDVGSCCSGFDPNTYQMVLFENTDSILIQYGLLQAITEAGVNKGDGTTSTSWTPASNTAFMVDW